MLRSIINSKKDSNRDIDCQGRSNGYAKQEAYFPCFGQRKAFPQGRWLAWVPKVILHHSLP